MEWNNFYGALLIDREYERSKTFITDEMIKKGYEYFHPSLFSLPVQERGFYYDEMLIAFGRTGKYLLKNERELQKFIKEFEDILDNMDFSNAQINISVDYANYNLFWNNKEKLLREYGSTLKTTMEYFEMNKVRYFENERSYFGLGIIDIQTGWVEEPYDPDKLRDFDLKYPEFKYLF